MAMIAIIINLSWWWGMLCIVVNYYENY